VGHLWFADPRTRHITAHALGADGKRDLLDLVLPDERIRVPPFEAVEFDIASLWGP